jgi:hypothetical protein
MESSAAVALFPWRQLGALLVEEELLTPTELELALDEQRRTGRLLGQIVVDRGYISAFSLARVLSAQHGVALQQPEEPEPELHLTAVPTTWRPLGRLLVEKGVVTQTQLAEALLAQQGNRRLGEILVERGVLSGADLARALAEQHGLDADSFAADLQTELKAAPTAEPVYRVYQVTFRRGFQERTSLWEHANFLEAADYAMEYVQDHQPEALEIERVDGEQQETVWTYSESRAAAADLARKDLVDTFGFDPTRWGVGPRR